MRHRTACIAALLLTIGSTGSAPFPWQTFDVIFQAARFDEPGNKTAHAKNPAQSEPEAAGQVGHRLGG
jgi:hypothetical protein